MGRYRPGDKAAARVRQQARYAVLSRVYRRSVTSFLRVSADGVMSAPIKRNDPYTEALIAAALERRDDHQKSDL